MGQVEHPTPSESRDPRAALIGDIAAETRRRMEAPDRPQGENVGSAALGALADRAAAYAEAHVPDLLGRGGMDQQEAQQHAHGIIGSLRAILEKLFIEPIRRLQFGSRRTPPTK